jgi:hypothetical protein
MFMTAKELVTRLSLSVWGKYSIYNLLPLQKKIWNQDAPFCTAPALLEREREMG